MKSLAVELKLSGHFTMTVTKPDGSSRVVAEFDNLITNTGLEQYGLRANNNLINQCCVGTGTTAPAFSDTSLVNQIAYTSTTQPVNSNGTYANVYASGYIRFTKTFRFAEGAAAGNLTEVGIRVDFGAGNGPLFSRARIVDGSNNPTSITILSDETLDVTYELRAYRPTGDVTGNITLGGVSYAYVMRQANAEDQQWAMPDNGFSNRSAPQAFSGDIAAINSSPSGFLGQGTIMSFAAYVNNSRQIDATHGFALNAPTTSIKSVVIDTRMGIYQIGFTPVIPKTAANILSLVFRFSWARRTI